MIKRVFLFIALTLMSIGAGAWEYRKIDGMTFEYDPSSHTAMVFSNGEGAGKYSGDIVIPESTCIDGEDYTVVGIESNAFKNCEDVTSITIPGTVTSIGNSAFVGTGITSITISKNVTYIGMRALGNCRKLASVTVEEGNPEFDSRNNCNAIIHSKDNMLIAGCVNTVIPNSVTVIGPEAFYQCSDITSVYLPASVEKIGDRAFSGCRLENIVARNPHTIGVDAFMEETRLSSMLYVPVGTVNDADFYSDYVPWNRFINIREMAAKVDEISISESYMLMSAESYDYAVYNSSSGQVKMMKGFYSTDEAALDNYWQIVDTDDEQCLYNVGAGKYATITPDGDFMLSDIPVPVNMADGEQGVVMNGVPVQQWNFVQIIKVDTGINSASLPTAKRTNRSSGIYDLQGRQLNGKPEKGIYIQNGKKVRGPL